MRGYDYSSPGPYFLTICAQDREPLFGEIVDGRMTLSVYGEIVCECWDGLPGHYPRVVLETFVVMPNHVHGIVVLAGAVAVPNGVGAGLKPAPTGQPDGRQHAVPEVVRGFKAFSARRINALRRTPGRAVWQRNYYEHVVRGDDSLERIRQYIEENPIRWADDEYHV